LFPSYHCRYEEEIPDEPEKPKGALVLGQAGKAGGKKSGPAAAKAKPKKKKQAGLMGFFTKK
jgi:hypothetical protein